MRENYYQLTTNDVNSTICFVLYPNGKVEFKTYALVDEDWKFLASFANEAGAIRAQSNSRYGNCTVVKLALPDELVVKCVANTYFDTTDDVLSFIKGGYKEAADYKIVQIEKEISGVVDVDSLDLDAYKEYKQELNKAALAEFLENNPIPWTDGKLYGVTQDDQIEMQTDLAAYNLKQAAGDTDWKLEWHDKTKACREFTLEEFNGLMNAIVDYVYPLRRKQEQIKEEIYNCQTKEELDAVVISYEDEVVDEETVIGGTDVEEPVVEDTTIEETTEETVTEESTEETTEETVTEESTEETTEETATE